MVLWKGFSASLKTGKITKKIHINFRSYRSLFFVCRWPDSNRHGYSPLDFESSASTNSATAARSDNQNKIYFTIKAGRVQEGNLE